MRMLHTSDWHLGRALYGRKRYDEFADFLNWLARKIDEEQIEVLLVSGDIFDTTTPSNRAQALYYRFLTQVSNSVCRHIVVIAGNHDSPSFLNAPKELLLALNVHVVATISDNLQDEVIELQNYRDAADKESAAVEAVICAVPYLRDREIRTVASGERVEDKNQKLTDAIKQHFEAVATVAEEKREQAQQVSGRHIPLIIMGHLFAAGGKTVDGDGVRELYVGSLAQVKADIFCSTADYVALGHLHVPQQVAGNDTIRYSGSPLPMGFGEAKQQKSVVIVEWDHSVMADSGMCPSMQVRVEPIESFQKLVQIKGDIETIEKKLLELKEAFSHAWLEIIYTGNEVIGNLRDRLETICADSKLEILRIKNAALINRVMVAAEQNESLDDLDEEAVFARCLDSYEVPQEQRNELLRCYKEILAELEEADNNAE